MPISKTPLYLKWTRRSDGMDLLFFEGNCLVNKNSFYFKIEKKRSQVIITILSNTESSIHHNHPN